MLARNEVLQERYRIVRQLGRGGMGAVYEAIDERFGEAVALKEIVTETLSSDSQKELFVRAFEREARVLAKARHEAVPYVRDYFSEFGRQFLVMELIEGADLAEMLERRQSPFPLEDVLNWLDQLLDALDYLHTLQPPLIHRDIKPQNLKLTSRGKIKLLDFGISKTVDAANTVTNQTFVGATINYSPIEQILPAITQTFREFIILKHERKAQYVLSQNTDARCDIYAAGATIYHLVTGRPPIDAAKRSLEMWEGGHDPLLNPTELNPVIPPAISAFLLKSLEVDRERRYPSAVEMRKILHAVVNEEIRRKKEAEAAAIRLAAEQERMRSAAAAERESSPNAPLAAPPIPLPSTPPPPPATAHSETEPLVAGDEFAETIRDISAHIQHLPTEQFQMPAVVSPPAASSSTPMTEQPAPSAFDAPLPPSSLSAPVKRPDTDPTLKPASDTHPTGGISEFELTAVSHLAEILGQNEEEAAAFRKNESDSQPKSSASGRLSAVSEAPAAISNAATPAAIARASRKNSFPLWILPIAAVGILAAFGLLIGGLIWLNTPGEPDTPPRPENVLHPTPAPTAAFDAAPAQTPTPVSTTPDLTTPTPAVSPVSTPNEQPSADSMESGQSKPQTVSPTGAKTPVSTTPKTVNTKTTTPPGRRAPSQRTTKPKTPDANCIYTNSC